MNEDVNLNSNTMKEQSTLRAMINEIVTREE
jgi:hypothetical protein